MTATVRTAALSMICLPLTACMLDAEEPGVVPEELGTIESTLCSDGPPDAVASFVDRGGLSVATASLETHQYNHPACERRFVVEVTGLAAATQPFTVAASFADPPGSHPIHCAWSGISVQTFEYGVQSVQCSGGGICLPTFGWRPVGAEIVLRGVMKPGLGEEDYCEWVPESPLPTFQPSALRNKIRVAVGATALLSDVEPHVYAGVDSPPFVH